MVQRRFAIPAALALALSAALVSTPLSAVSPKKAKSAVKIKKPDLTDALFSSETVPHIQIEIGEAALAKLRQYEWKFGSQTERESVPATVREGHTTWTNVSLHLKGAAGSFRSVD